MIKDGVLHFNGLLAMEDGSELVRTEASGDPKDAVKIGNDAGEKLKAQVPHLIAAFQLSAEEQMLTAPVKAKPASA